MPGEGIRGFSEAKAGGGPGSAVFRETGGGVGPSALVCTGAGAGGEIGGVGFAGGMLGMLGTGGGWVALGWLGPAVGSGEVITALQ